MTFSVLKTASGNDSSILLTLTLGYNFNASVIEHFCFICERDQLSRYMYSAEEEREAANAAPLKVQNINSFNTYTFQTSVLICTFPTFDLTLLLQ